MKPALYINKEGKIQYIADLPEEPKYCADNDTHVILCNNTFCRCEKQLDAYRKALQAAKDSAVDCADQDAGWKLIFPQPEMQAMYNFKFDPKEEWVSYREGNQSWGRSAKSDTIHPFPEKYEVEVKDYFTRDGDLDTTLAVITPKKEEPKQEESQEEKEAMEWELWRDFLYDVGCNCRFLHAEVWEDTQWEKLMEKLKGKGYSITRRDGKD